MVKAGQTKTRHKEEVLDTKKFWTKLFGFKVGDRVQMHRNFRTRYGTIIKLIKAVEINGDRTRTIPSASVIWDGKSKIPWRQVIPLEDLEIEGYEG